jgi:hypothetical protein
MVLIPDSNAFDPCVWVVVERGAAESPKKSDPWLLQYQENSGSPITAWF